MGRSRQRRRLFRGVVLACVLAENFPAQTFILIERNAKKAAFLREALRRNLGAWHRALG